MERAEELLRCHDPLGALERFDAALAQDGDNEAALGGRIRALWALRRTAEARAALADATATRPRTPPLLLAEGTLALGLPEAAVDKGVHASTRDFDDAVARAVFTAVLDLDPADVVARRGLCTAHRLADRPAEARAVLEAAPSAGASPYPAAPGLLVEHALLAFDAWELEAALDAVNLALRIRPDDVEATLLKVCLLQQDERLGESRALAGELRRRTVGPCPALDVVEGWLAYDAWSELAAFQVPDPDDTTPSALLAEAQGHFRRALETLPDLPEALNGLLHLAGFGGLPEPELPQDATAWPSLLVTRAWIRLRRNETEAALADFRLVHSLVPHWPNVAHGLVSCLRTMGRRREARGVAEPSCERYPHYPWVRVELGFLELDDGRHERAAQLFAEAGHHDRFGLVAALRQLECADTAEALALARLERWPRNEYLLSEYAACAYDQGHVEEALTRYRNVLSVAPHNEDALEKTKQQERLLKRRFGRLRPPRPGQQENSSDDAERAALISDLLPGDTPPRLAARLRALGRRQAAITNWNGRLDEAANNVALVLAGIVLGTWWLLLGPLGSPPTWVTALVLVGVQGLSLTVGTVLLLRVGQTALPTLLIWTALATGGLTAALWSGHGHPAAVFLVPAMGVLSSALIWWLVLGTYALAALPAKIALARLRSRDRFTYLVADLIDLLAFLEYEPALRESAVRRQGLDLLEQIARGQEHVLVEPLGPQGRRSTIEESIGRAFRHHVSGIASATRDLKRSVLSPGPDTWRTLHALLAEVLCHTVHARWDRLPHRQPDPAGRVLRVRLLGAVRNLLVLLIPPALVLTLQGTGVLPASIPTELQIAAYIGWPAVVALLWLDPTLAKKIDLLKTSTDTLRNSISK
ncbi:tetratricopeptide repeat protein [Streptomyces sp. NPDC047061]|uniref:tetratricopeptide repeat protein n=1 Tax=Streptomyces sp. NPDC047061 TaxID=3154605 RepID=UPI0033FB1DEB